MEHYTNFKMITVHHLWRSIFKCFLNLLWLHIKVRKHLLLCKMYEIIVLSGVLKLIIQSILTDISSNIRFNIRFHSNISLEYLAGGQSKVD